MNDTINIKKIYDIFVSNRTIIIKTTFVFFITSIIYVSVSNNYYKSTISLYAAGELDDSSLFSHYGSLAENLGIAMLPASNYYIPDIIDSRSLKKEIVLKKWNNYKFSKPANLIDYWEINNPSFLSNSLSIIKNIFVTKQFKNIEISYLNEGIEQLSELIYVDEQSSGLIVVSVFMEEPKLSAEIANYISSYVVDFIKNQQKDFANKSKDFILGRLNISTDELHDSEERLTAFRKKHPLVLDTPDLQLDRARLMRNVEVNQEVFITLRQQLEIAKIESSKERLFINILDKAEANPDKDKPKRILIILIFTFCGLFISILYQIIRINFKKIIST